MYSYCPCHSKTPHPVQRPMCADLSHCLLVQKANVIDWCRIEWLFEGLGLYSKSWTLTSCDWWHVCMVCRRLCPGDVGGRHGLLGSQAGCQVCQRLCSWKGAHCARNGNCPSITHLHCILLQQLCTKLHCRLLARWVVNCVACFATSEQLYLTILCCSHRGDCSSMAVPKEGCATGMNTASFVALWYTLSKSWNDYQIASLTKVQCKQACTILPFHTVTSR